MKRKIQTANVSRALKGRKHFRPVRLIILLFAAVLFLSSGWQVYKLHTRVSDEITRLNEQRVQLIEEKKELEDEIVQLNTASYIEQLAREQLGLVKKGEIRIAPKK